MPSLPRGVVACSATAMILKLGRVWLLRHDRHALGSAWPVSAELLGPRSDEPNWLIVDVFVGADRARRRAWPKPNCPANACPLIAGRSRSRRNGRCAAPWPW